MTGPCFVDANVIVYARDSRDATKQQRAAAWLEYLWREQLGRTSIQVLSESYVTLKRLGAAATEELWDRVARYFAWAPHPVDEALLRRAREIEQRWRLSWWDSMVVAAAQLQDCALLLTEDLQDGAVFGGVTVCSPFTLDVGEPAAAYAAHPAAASRHRPRGRPRKKTATQRRNPYPAS
ncbi:MAG: PIN domain-containing protein [Betaproteobacteria bacterium]|nr:PIN domain-containing protein [Betaproteobacteria bacterium]MBI2509000.1 PIN domain-containing protein [Betaproteobacteria bacterium]